MSKVKIEVFYPAGACGCSYGRWIDSIYRIVRPFKKQGLASISSNSNDSDRAKELGILLKGVAVNGQLTKKSRLKEKIQEEIENRNN